MADAAVSKTVEGQLSCRFESGLRHQPVHSIALTSIEFIFTVNCCGIALNGIIRLNNSRVAAIDSAGWKG
jgi:hypothetical protein